MSTDPISDNERLVDAINTHRETLQETNSILLAIARTLVYMMEDAQEIPDSKIDDMDGRFIARMARLSAINQDLDIGLYAGTDPKPDKVK